MKGPGDKLDIDDYDDLGEYIADAMNEGYTLEAEDFEGRPCSYCGETIDFTEWDDVVTWDIQVMDMETMEDQPYVARYYFCSEQCRRDSMTDEEWLQGGSEYGEEDRIHVDELEANR